MNQELQVLRGTTDVSEDIAEMRVSTITVHHSQTAVILQWLFMHAWHFIFPNHSLTICFHSQTT